MKITKKSTVRNEQKINAQRCNNANMTSQHKIVCKNTLPTQKQTNFSVRKPEKTHKSRREKPAKNKKCESKYFGNKNEEVM